jgi:crossover junction endodeoxyribonuclease RuvC
VSNLNIVGIDNGLKGAIVVIDESFRLVDYRDTPTLNLGKKGKTKSEFATAEMGKILRDFTNSAKRTMIWLEQAQAMPKQGLSSTFKTGRGFGLWEGICIGLGLRYDIVHPATWTKTVLKDMPAGEPKARSMAKCQRLFPDLPLTKPRGSVLSLDGRADAALIAYYGLMQLTGGKRATVERKPPPRHPAK